VPEQQTEQIAARVTATWVEEVMADKFRALLATKDSGPQSVAITELTESDLMDGEVTVAVEHSTVNYKDGLAITGKVPIIHKFPLIPGVDLAGSVLHSDDPRFQAGDRIAVNGYGLGEVHHGGYAEWARVKGDWLIRLPARIGTSQAMAIGTAGYTAMLCVLVLEHAGVTPDRGPVLVTGAAGGGGSVAIALLDKLGYHVIASSRRAEEEADYLHGLGADEIIDARELSKTGSLLEQRALVRRSRFCRQPNTRKRTVADQIRWRGGGLWFGTRFGPTGNGHAVHPARRDARGSGFSLGSARKARRGLGSFVNGPRYRETRQHDSAR